MAIQITDTIEQKEVARIREKGLAINRALTDYYGPPPPRHHYDPLSTLVLTVLTQHTSDVNAERAFESLVRAFPSWEAVRDAGVQEIAQAIRPAGLSNVKAPRIKEILQRISDLNGKLNLDFLHTLDSEKARAWLLALKGVGPKTAACVLIFSLGKPAMPVDTHVHRVCCRVGLVGPKVTAEHAQEILESVLPPEDQRSFHVNVITHGRKICKAQLPLCSECPINHLCDWAANSCQPQPLPN
jgi:endonuclease-3